MRKHRTGSRHEFGGCLDCAVLGFAPVSTALACCVQISAKVAQKMTRQQILQQRIVTPQKSQLISRRSPTNQKVVVNYVILVPPPWRAKSSSVTTRRSVQKVGFSRHQVLDAPRADGSHITSTSSFCDMAIDCLLER